VALGRGVCNPGDERRVRSGRDGVGVLDTRHVYDASAGRHGDAGRDVVGARGPGAVLRRRLRRAADRQQRLRQSLAAQPASRQSSMDVILSEKITDRSFRYASLCLWNQLPLSLRQPHSHTSASISDLHIPLPITFPPLVYHSVHFSSITPSFFYSRLKNLPVSQILPPVVSFLHRDCLHGLSPGPFLLSYSVFAFSFPYFSFLVPCARLSWPPVSF